MRETPKKPDGGKARARQKRQGPKKATRQHLENAALYYLERFATSAENLRRVLMRRVAKSAEAHGTDADEGAAMVDDLIRRYRGAGLLDDAAYARARAATLHRSGNSARAIRAKLMQKGVGTADVDQALDTLGNETEEPELAAAVRLARRRRLGPFRDGKTRAETRKKDLATLGRAGFSYDVARRVVDAERAEDLERS